MLHPATLYLGLTLVVVIGSWLGEIYGWSAVMPQTGEELRVQSLLSPEGLRWWLRQVIRNFTGFSPLGMSVVALWGLGLAQYTGLVDACIRLIAVRRPRPYRVVLAVVLAGLLANAVGDAGYILLIPVSALLFSAVGLHPVGGLVTAYVSVACGYSANIFLSTMDPLLAHTTREATLAQTGYEGNTAPLANYFFMAVSTLVLMVVIGGLTMKMLLPRLAACPPIEPLHTAPRGLSGRERRAFRVAAITGLVYLLLVLLLTFSPYGVLRSVSGGIMHSPFVAGILFLLSLGLGLMGLAYGFSAGRFRSDADLIDGFSQPMPILGQYLPIVFFASQMFACFEYSGLDRYLVIVLAHSIDLSSFAALPALLIFMGMVAVANLFMVSATTKWTLLSYLFIPLFVDLGVSPAVTQCAFRIGDSATNGITPFLYYMPLVLVYLCSYLPHSGYLTLLGYTWRYSLCILLVWMLLFALWFATGLPLGL